jgi:hypothetical protein
MNTKRESTMHNRPSFSQYLRDTAQTVRSKPEWMKAEIGYKSTTTTVVEQQEPTPRRPQQ